MSGKDGWMEIARSCLDAAETGAMTFPQIVGTLMQAGVEAYRIDLRRGLATYYKADGQVMDWPLPTAFEVAETFDTAEIQAAIRSAQTLEPGYTYPGFCRRVTAAGCADYLVSFLGRRALYVGRTGETHVERFPD